MKEGKEEKARGERKRFEGIVRGRAWKTMRRKRRK